MMQVWMYWSHSVIEQYEGKIHFLSNKMAANQAFLAHFEIWQYEMIVDQK